MANALELSELSKSYGRTSALRNCSLALPTGCIAALVGPNGAGKSTLLHLAAGLLTPTTGIVRVLDRVPGADEDALARIGFVGQGAPLYPSFTAEDLISFGNHMNRRWEGDEARDQLRGLRIPLDRRSSSLSMGQRAQLALVLALAKRPEVLLLDEPLANVDPLARRELMGNLMADVAERGTTVIISSHLIADLERICDRIIILSDGHLELDGRIDQLLDAHKALTGPSDANVPPATEVIQRNEGTRQTTLIAKTNTSVTDATWEVHDLSLEALVLAYLARGSSQGAPITAEVGGTR